jgi:hypothetical protein
MCNLNRVGGMLGVVHARWAAILFLWVGRPREVEKDDDIRESSE